MNTEFFERPILNSPYAYPGRHWELDESGQPTSLIIDRRRRVSFITPIPNPPNFARPILSSPYEASHV